jgi:hypothetical protein
MGIALPSLSSKHLIAIDRESPEIEMKVREMPLAELNH